MPRDRDAVVPEGWRKCEHLPQFVVCPNCQAICDSDGVQGHIEWHDSFATELNQALRGLIPRGVTL